MRCSSCGAGPARRRAARGLGVSPSPSLIEPELTEPAAPIAVIVVACYACARYRADLWGIAAVALMLDLGDPAVLRWSRATTTSPTCSSSGALLVPPFVFGRVARKLDEQTRLLEEQQEALQQQAVRAERDRIARELHDVIAHSVSAMVVQTAAAQDLVTSDPARAQQVLDGVAATGRARSRRPRGCCTSSATTPTSSAWSRCRGWPTWTGSSRSSRSRAAGGPAARR